MVLPFLALYLTARQGFSAQEAGGVLSLYGVGSIGGSYLGGVCSDRLGPLRAQFLGLSLTAGSLILLSVMQSPVTIITVVLVMSIFAGSLPPSNAAALAALSPLLIGATVLVWTLGEMLPTPLLEGFVATRSRGAQQGQYIGLFSMAFSLAFVAAPLGGTWIYEVYGYRALWWTCGVLGVVLWGAFLALSVVVKKQDLPVAAQPIAVASQRLD